MKIKIISIVLFSIFITSSTLTANIFEAVKDNNLELVKEIVNKDNGTITEENASGETPLYLVIVNGQQDMLELFLTSGIMINEKFESGDALLHSAVKAGRIKIIKFLLDNGADINIRNNLGDTALHCAVKAGQINTVRLLLNYNANVNVKNECRVVPFFYCTNGRTPLHYAAKRGNLEIAKLLLDYGANPNAKNQGVYDGFFLNDLGGKTPLHDAIAYNRKETAQLLLIYGANINEKDNYDKLPRDYALQYNYLEIAKSLEIMAEKEEISEKMLNLFTVNKDDNTIEAIENFILESQTPIYLKIKVIETLLKAKKEDPYLISRSKLRRYIQQIPSRLYPIKNKLFLEWILDNKNIKDMQGKKMIKVLSTDPFQEAIPLIFDSEPRLYNMYHYKSNQELFNNGNFINKMFEVAKKKNNQRFLRRFLNTKRLSCLLNKHAHLPADTIGKVMGYFNDEQYSVEIKDGFCKLSEEAVNTLLQSSESSSNENVGNSPLTSANSLKNKLGNLKSLVLSYPPFTWVLATKERISELGCPCLEEKELPMPPVRNKLKAINK